MRGDVEAKGVTFARIAVPLDGARHRFRELEPHYSEPTPKTKKAAESEDPPPFTVRLPLQFAVRFSHFANWKSVHVQPASPE